SGRGASRSMAWVALPVVLAAASAVAQTAVDGAIRGSVFDATGAAVPGALIRVESQSAGTALRTVTDAHGEFVAARVAPGEYGVGLEATGFEPGVARVVVVVGGVAEISVRLKPAGVATMVSVTADSPG